MPFAITNQDIGGILYVDARSIGGESQNDFDVSMKENVVGSMNPFKKGNIFILAIKRKYTMSGWIIRIGRIIERIPICTLWKDLGGEEWPHNYVVEFLTPKISVTDPSEVFSFLLRVCKEEGFDKDTRNNTLSEPQIFSKLFTTHQANGGYKKNRFRPVWKRFFETFKYEVKN